MRRVAKASLLLLLAAVVAACVNEREMRKRDIQHFMQTATGEYNNEAGDAAGHRAGVRAHDRPRHDVPGAHHGQRHHADGCWRSRSPATARNSCSSRYVFTQQGQWRNLLEQPELLSALQPNDVRAAGTCDIQLAEDMNSMTYTCGGSTPTVYQRVQHAMPE